MATTERQFIHFREAQFKGHLRTLEISKNFYQKLLDEITKLDLIKPETVQELINFASLTEHEIKDLLTKDVQQLNWGGYKLSREKTIEMLELPDLSMLKELRADMHKYGSYQYLTIKGGSVVIEKKDLETIKNQCCYFAENEDQLKLYKAYMEAVNAMQNFNLAYYKLRKGSIVHSAVPVDELFRIEQGINPGVDEGRLTYERVKEPLVTVNDNLLHKFFGRAANK